MSAVGYYDRRDITMQCFYDKEIDMQTDERLDDEMRAWENASLSDFNIFAQEKQI